MRSFLFFLLLLFNSIIVWSIDFQRTIVWHQPDSGAKSEMRHPGDLFEGAVSEGAGNLPFWVENFELQSTNAEVIIINTVFEPFNDNSIILPDSTGSELKYYTVTGTSAGKTFLKLYVFPFVRRNNQILKLTEFTIKVIENSNLLKSANAIYPWKSTSVLGSGKWTKIKTKNKGIYKITYDQLKQWGYANPEKVCMYGNGGYMLPVLNRDLNADDLLAYPVWKGKDNANKDCLFFYSSGNIELNQNIETGIFTHQQNYYSTETYFYLSDQGTLLLIEKAAELTGTAGRQLTTYPNYTFYEKELLNLISSGSQWFGERFNQGATQTINISLDNPDLTKPATFAVSAVGRSSANSNMDVYLNTKSVDKISFQATDVSDATSYYANEKISNFTENLPAKNISLKMTYNATNGLSEAWLDFISVNYQSLLRMLLISGEGELMVQPRFRSFYLPRLLQEQKYGM
jgi:hypothetical protein